MRACRNRLSSRTVRRSWPRFLAYGAQIPAAARAETDDELLCLGYSGGLQGTPGLPSVLKKCALEHNSRVGVTSSWRMHGNGFHLESMSNRDVFTNPGGARAEKPGYGRLDPDR